MTNAELIANIKAEIERLYNDKSYSEDRWDMGYDCACEDMMYFLSTLLESEKEQPICDEQEEPDIINILTQIVSHDHH